MSEEMRKISLIMLLELKGISHMYMFKDVWRVSESRFEFVVPLITARRSKRLEGLACGMRCSLSCLNKQHSITCNDGCHRRPVARDFSRHDSKTLIWNVKQRALTWLLSEKSSGEKRCRWTCFRRLNCRIAPCSLMI